MSTFRMGTIEVIVIKIITVYYQLYSRGDSGVKVLGMSAKLKNTPKKYRKSFKKGVAR